MKTYIPNNIQTYNSVALEQLDSELVARYMLLDDEQDNIEEKYGKDSPKWVNADAQLRLLASDISVVRARQQQIYRRDRQRIGALVPNELDLLERHLISEVHCAREDLATAGDAETRQFARERLWRAEDDLHKIADERDTRFQDSQITDEELAKGAQIIENTIVPQRETA